MRKEIKDPRLKEFLNMVGQNVRRLRGTMEQIELAKLAKVSRSTVQAAEKGKPISISNLYKIAMVLKIHPARLCTEEMTDEGFRDNLKTMMREILGEILVSQNSAKKS